MRPAYYVPIGGTRSWNDIGAPKRRWWQSESDFCKYMATLNCVMLYPNQPFVWTTDLGGVEFWRRWPIWFGKVSRLRDHRDWVAAAENLIRYLDSEAGPEAFENRNLIAHSHGGQVAFYAAALGLKIRNLLTVATPERADMADAIGKARPNIQRWVHIYDDRADRVATEGAFGDGAFSMARDFNVSGMRPDFRVAISGISHSGILNDPACIMYWRSKGIAEYLRD